MVAHPGGWLMPSTRAWASGARMKPPNAWGLANRSRYQPSASRPALISALYCASHRVISTARARGEAHARDLATFATAAQLGGGALVPPPHTAKDDCLHQNDRGERALQRAGKGLQPQAQSVLASGRLRHAWLHHGNVLLQAFERGFPCRFLRRNECVASGQLQPLELLPPGRFPPKASDIGNAAYRGRGPSLHTGYGAFRVSRNRGVRPTTTRVPELAPRTLCAKPCILGAYNTYRFLRFPRGTSNNCA